MANGMAVDQFKTLIFHNKMDATVGGSDGSANLKIIQIESLWREGYSTLPLELLNIWCFCYKTLGPDLYLPS